MADVPVAVFAFNRPEMLRAQLARLARVSPRDLFVVVDGPRGEADAVAVDAVHEVLHHAITWDADVRTLLRTENLGCQASVQEGLDWVFAQVDRAVILEDDVEVAPGFFDFAEQALRAYADDPRVGLVSAKNALIEYSPDGRGAFLSLRGAIWGWATWASRWQRYRARFAAEEANLPALIAATAPPLLGRVHIRFLQRRSWDVDDDWTASWASWCSAHGWASVTPARNMAMNVGFSDSATHTSVSGDLRGAYPAVAEVRSPGVPAPAQITWDDSYAEAFTLLDLVVLYDQPRRWRLLAKAASTRDDVSDAVDLMLAPWRDQQRTRSVLEHLGAYMRNDHLDELRAAFGC